MELLLRLVLSTSSCAHVRRLPRFLSRILIPPFSVPIQRFPCSSSSSASTTFDTNPPSVVRFPSPLLSPFPPPFLPPRPPPLLAPFQLPFPKCLKVPSRGSNRSNPPSLMPTHNRCWRSSMTFSTVLAASDPSSPCRCIYRTTDCVRGS